jgi:hypothetical protein
MRSVDSPHVRESTLETLIRRATSTTMRPANCLVSFEPIPEVNDLFLKRRDSPPQALHNRKPRTPQGGVFALGLCQV